MKPAEERFTAADSYRDPFWAVFFIVHLCSMLSFIFFQDSVAS
jgi:hypothetical protein